MRKGCIYSGEIIHRRLLPRAHFLSYSGFMLFLDVSKLDDLSGLKFISVNRFNLFSFYESDYGVLPSNNGKNIYQRIKNMLSDLGIASDGRDIFILTMPRVLGFVFNPISIYYIMNGDRVEYVIYEVNNTFGDRHSYVLEINNDQIILQETQKRLHVSPFMATNGMKYKFKLALPSDDILVNIKLLDNKNQKYLFASFKGHADKLNDANLWKIFWKLPFFTIKVVFGIHYEALKLIFKGLWLKPKPKTPKSGISLNNNPTIS